MGLFTLHGQAGIINSQSVYLPLVNNSEPTPTPTITPFPTQTPSPASDFEERVVELTNIERQNYGCEPVTMDTRLWAAAAGHSEDMAVNDFFSHTGSDGSSPDERIIAQGYIWSGWGENIAAGYTSPESVVNAWMSSSGHRANILNCSFVHIGVGYFYLENDTGNFNYYHYWTQDFASPQ